MHLVRVVLDEVFGAENSVASITIQKSGGLGSKLLTVITDYLLWYAKDRNQVKYRQLYRPRDERVADPELDDYDRVELATGDRRPLTREELANPALLPEGARRYKRDNLLSQGYRPNTTVEYRFEGVTFFPGPNRCWKTTVAGLDQLAARKRLESAGSGLWYVRFADDLPARALNNLWVDTSSSFMANKRYIVQTVPKVIARCLLMTTDPGDLVLDPTCGSGTTAHVAEQFGRRWIYCDTSRVALAIARERLLTATFPYYRLLDEDRGVDGGFIYQVIQRVTLGSLAHGEPAEVVALYDRPELDGTKLRVSGPFTVEALSRYAVNPLEENVPPEPDDPQAAETQDHIDILLEALQKQGIPRRDGKPIPIDSLQRLASVGAIQADGTYSPNGSVKSFGVSLGPRFGPVTISQIDEALHDAYGYDLVVFAGFAATAEAQSYVAKGKLGRFNVALLEANPDLLVGDLLKSTPSSQTFRLFSAPEINPKRDGDEVRIEVIGVDSFDASTGDVVSRSQRDIAAWFLDSNYDGLVFHVTQAFFPRTNGWEALQRALKGIIDPELMEQLESFESLPFKPGEYKKAAVRVVDDSGTTSEAVIDLS